MQEPGVPYSGSRRPVLPFLVELGTLILSISQLLGRHFHFGPRKKQLKNKQEKKGKQLVICKSFFLLGWKIPRIFFFFLRQH